MTSLNDGIKNELNVNSNWSWKTYAKHVMSLSLVTGVSNIITTKSWPRKIFKMAVLVLCTSGFFYQATEFISFFLRYPHVINLEVYTPETFMKPAFTYCNNNGISRSKFCAKYPNRCETVNDTEAFCEAFKEFCEVLPNKQNIKVVKKEYYIYEESITYKELLEIGEVDKRNWEFDGPFLQESHNSGRVLCYSYNLRIDSPNPPHEMTPPSRFNSLIKSFYPSMNAGEVFRPDRIPGIFFTVHSPFFWETPFINGIFLRPKHKYKVNVKLEEEVLLPYPYQTNCTNYTENWIQNGFSGPRSRKMSIEKCLFEVLMNLCNCTNTAILYPTNASYCTHDDMISCYSNHPRNDLEASKDFESCLAKYKNDCEIMKFSFTRQELPYEKKVKELYEYGEPEINSWIKVELHMYEKEVHKITYRPQIQKFEVFSYIGGYIGVWMGVSLVAVIDFVESLFSLLLFHFRRKTQAELNYRVQMDTLSRPL